MASHRLLYAIPILSLIQIACFFKLPYRTQTQRTFAIEYLENCEKKECPISLSRLSFRRNDTFYYMSGEEVVSEDIKPTVSTQYRIEKCKDKSNPDTCEYYVTWKWDNLCVYLNVFPFFKEFENAHTPPFTCPLKKNHYKLENFKMRSDALMPFLGTSEPRALWKFRITATEADGGRMVACLDLALKVVSIRVKI